MKTSIQMFCTPNVLCRARGSELGAGVAGGGLTFSEPRPPRPKKRCERFALQRVPRARELYTENGAAHSLVGLGPRPARTCACAYFGARAISPPESATGTTAHWGFVLDTARWADGSAGCIRPLCNEDTARRAVSRLFCVTKPQAPFWRGFFSWAGAGDCARCAHFL
jgi:hypothetical protein